MLPGTITSMTCMHAHMSTRTTCHLLAALCMGPLRRRLHLECHGLVHVCVRARMCVTCELVKGYLQSLST